MMIMSDTKKVNAEMTAERVKEDNKLYGPYLKWDMGREIMMIKNTHKTLYSRQGLNVLNVSEYTHIT